VNFNLDFAGCAAGQGLGTKKKEINAMIVKEHGKHLTAASSSATKVAGACPVTCASSVKEQKA